MTNSIPYWAVVPKPHVPPLWWTMVQSPVGMFAWITLAVLAICFVVAIFSSRPKATDLRSGAWFIAIAHLQLLVFLFLRGVMGARSAFGYMSGPHLSTWTWDLRGILLSILVEAICVSLMCGAVLRRAQAPWPRGLFIASVVFLGTDILFWFSLVSAFAGIGTASPPTW